MAQSSESARVNDDVTLPCESVPLSPPTTTAAVKLPSYPIHGVIGTSKPAWMDAFYISRSSKATTKQDFKKQKFDFHKTYENTEFLPNREVVVTPLPGLSNLWRKFNEGRTTADVYEVDSLLPNRFRNPEQLRGYGCEKSEHPLFRTSSSTYGQFPPTIHDVPRKYHALQTTFTSHLASTGMPKNRSLNIK